MKISSTYRLDARLLEFLFLIQTSTGVDKTKTVEKVIRREAEDLALVNPAIKIILSKTPRDLDRDKRRGSGVFKYIQKS